METVWSRAKSPGLGSVNQALSFSLWTAFCVMFGKSLLISSLSFPIYGKKDWTRHTFFLENSLALKCHLYLCSFSSDLCFAVLVSKSIREQEPQREKWKGLF